MSDLLTQGNEKTGRTIYTFNLPARTTCPGASQACDDCYAEQGRWRMPNVKQAVALRWQQSQEKTFAQDMVQEIHRKGVQRVRIHASGDFFSATYLYAWSEIITSCPATRFFGYTRSWRVQELCPLLCALALLPNMTLFWSCDKFTGLPPRPRRVRFAWLLTEPDELPPTLRRTDVVFRTVRARKAKQIRVSLGLVCVKENGTAAGKAMTCGSCRFCVEERSVDANETERRKP